MMARTAPAAKTKDNVGALAGECRRLIRRLHGAVRLRVLHAGQYRVCCATREQVTQPSISFTLFSMATAKEPTTAQSSNKPVQVFRLRGLSASIFENHAKSANRDVTFHKVSVQRTYREGDQWKTTTSFGRDDLPTIQLLLQRAWEFILDTEAGRGKEEPQE